MDIKVNGENKNIKENTSLRELFDSLDINSNIMASAVNMQVIKKDKWDELILKQNDEIEFLQFVGGG